MAQHIAIVSALHAELAEVLALMPDEHKRTVGGRTFWSGHLHGHEVVATLSGMGKVAAATTTSLLIDHFKAEQIIFTGVAGGLAVGTEVGDVVVGNGFVQHDMDASPMFPRFELPGQGITRLPADGVLTQVLQEAAEDAVTWLPKLLDAATLASLGLHRPAVHKGLIVSGDRFVSSNTEVQALRAALPEALAVDMESAAVAQVCRDFGVGFGAVRTISDRADNEAHVDFPRFLDQVARHYSARIIRKALNLL
ncbi:MAG TPA: 5'-methylthioadenosine/adenosylhomocysteine nucleosidase [Burkholderiaceae bacterium]|nr:5'-methylthioadenosine/adenosylhomocysteine nucleosidase [Burkholderiaceae bacterium]